MKFANNLEKKKPDPSEARCKRVDLVWFHLPTNQKQAKLTDAVKSQDSGCLLGKVNGKRPNSGFGHADHVLFINVGVSYRLCSLLYTYDVCTFLHTYFSKKLKNLKNKHEGPSLVAQWLRICLPMQETRVRALVWEDPTCRGATKPMSHNYWACVSGACAPQQERPR